MGRISELSDEERDTIFGRRLAKAFAGNREETLDFWDHEAAGEHDDREILDPFPGEATGTRGYRRRPHYLDDRDDWDWDAPWQQSS